MARLKIKGKIKGSGDDRVVDLSGDEVTVGRSPRNTVQIDDTAASRRHCRLENRAEGWVLCDLGSSNGTLLNDEKVEEKPLRHGDVIRIGKTTLELVEEVELDLELDADDGEPRFVLVHQSGDRLGDRIPLAPGRTVFGRQPGDGVRLEGTGVSAKHFEIRTESDRVVVRDLGSTNGTRVNGERVEEHTLAPDDAIQAGTVRLRFLDSEARETAAGDEPVAEGVSVLDADAAPRRGARSTLALLGLVVVLGVGGFFAFRMVNARAPYQFPVAPEGSLVLDGWSFETPGAVEAFTPDDDDTGIARAGRGASGEASLRLEAASGTDPRFVSCTRDERFDLGEGGAVRVSVAVHTGSLDGMAGAGVRWYPPGDRALPLAEDFTDFRAGGGGFAEVAGLLAAPTGARRFEVFLAAYASGGKAYFDDLVVVPETGGRSGLAAGGFVLRSGAKATFDLLRGEIRTLSDLEVVRVREGKIWPQRVFFSPESREGGAASFRSEGTVLLPDGSSSGRFAVEAAADDKGFDLAYTVSEPRTGIRFVLDADLAAGGITTVTGERYERFLRDFEGATAAALLLGESNQLHLRVDPEMVVSVETGSGGVTCTAVLPEGTAHESFRVRLQTTFEEERELARRLWIDSESALRAEEHGRALSLLERITRELPYNPRILEDAERRLAELRARAEDEMELLREERDDAEFFASPGRYRELVAHARRLAARYPGTRYGREAEEVARAASAIADTLEEQEQIARARAALARGRDLLASGRAALGRAVLEPLAARFAGSEVGEAARELLRGPGGS